MTPLEPPADWDRFVKAARKAGFCGFVLEQARRFDGLLEPHARLTLEREAMAVAAANRRQAIELEPIVSAFNRAAIPVMLLKGAALNRMLYDRPDLRPMSDLDLLVRPETAASALRVLSAQGCRRGLALIRSDFFPRYYYEVELMTGGVNPVRIDLHARPFRPLRLAQTMPDNAFWMDARSASIGRGSVTLPSPEVMFLHLTAHAAFHGAGRLLWLYDIKRFASSYRDSIDWDSVTDRARAWRLSLPVLRGIERAAAVFGPLCPTEVVAELARHGHSWRDRMTLAHAPRDARSPLGHVAVNLLATPGVRFKIGYVRNLLVPSRSHLAGIYPFRHMAWVPCAHVWRIIRALARAAASPLHGLRHAARRVGQRPRRAKPILPDRHAAIEHPSQAGQQIARAPSHDAPERREKSALPDRRVTIGNAGNGSRTVSVILTVKNDPVGCAVTLESLAGQTRRSDEIVVVDGGSTDSTVRVAESYMRRAAGLRVISAPGANIAQGRNTAVRAACGEIIASIDGGCRAEPEWLEQIVRPFEEDPGVEFVAGLYALDARSLFEEVVGLATMRGQLDPVHPETFNPSARSMACTKALWSRAGGWPEWLDFSEDTLFDQKVRRMQAGWRLARGAVVHWRPRHSPRAVARQFYHYGTGRGHTRIGARDFHYHLRNLLVMLVAGGLAFVTPWALVGLLLSFVYFYVWTFHDKALRIARRTGRRIAYPLCLCVLWVVLASNLLGFLVGSWQRWRHRERYQALVSAYLAGT